MKLFRTIVIWWGVLVALPLLVHAVDDEFVAVAPSGKTRIEWTFNRELGWSLALFRKGKTPIEVPRAEPERKGENLGIANIPDRKFRWMGQKYCLTTLDGGFGILDIEKAEWVCNLVTSWNFASGRNTVAYLLPRRENKVDTVGVYHFYSAGNDLEHHIYPLKGRVMSPIFESRYSAQVAFILLRTDDTKELTILATDSGKTLATRVLPARFAKDDFAWRDDKQKAGRIHNLELLSWIESATEYGPFWGPTPDNF